MTIDFKNIISHNGDKKAAFEELVCQLACLENIENGIEFRRKGRGADGGAECYWITSEGKEICWQAKYFTDRLNDSEWAQIDKSVKAAFKNHPNMQEYIICVPINRTDSRQSTNDGKFKNTEMVKWNKKVEKWKREAQESGINVKFTYWGESELVFRLISDNSHNQGIKNYFFDSHTINLETLKNATELSKVSLGERYSQDDNVELKISTVFDSLANTNSWKKELKTIFSVVQIKFTYEEVSKYSSLKTLNENVETIQMNTGKIKTDIPTLEQVDALSKNCWSFIDQIDKFQYEEKISEKISGLLEKIQSLKKVEGAKEIYSQLSKECNSLQKINEKLNKLRAALNKILNFLDNNNFKAYLNKIAVIDGNAGMGKSHLLCDNAIRLLNGGVPSLLLLGQHYSGGNPIAFIKNKLGIDKYNDEQALGLLNVMAETYKSRFVIIIDAINEGEHRKEWLHYLVDFINQIRKYPYISLVISCRTTYMEYLVPEQIFNDSGVIRLTHNGFCNIEEKAVEKYFLRRNLVMPSSPILKPEFSNPLFLKTCCDALVKRKLKSFPKGINGFVSLFEFYLDVINEKISKEIECKASRQVVFKYIDKFIELLFPDKIYIGINYEEAEELANDVYSKTDLLKMLCDEGLLSLDVHTDSNGRKTEIVRFTFERYGEHIIARHIITKCATEDDLASLFSEGKIIYNLIDKQKRDEYSGVISAISIYIAEKFHREFIEFLDKNVFEEDEYYFIENTFNDNILWRSPGGICQNSLDILRKMKEEANKVFLDVSTEPDHPWNILFVEKILFEKEMADRDRVWSIWVAEDYYSSVKNIISWAKQSDLLCMGFERAELLSYLMIWLFSTSNRYIRDTATKILTKIMYYYPKHMVTILNKYCKINDMYILERIYAAVLGAVVYIVDYELLSNVSETVYKLQFKDNKPTLNIMVREYATSIMEYVYSVGALSPEIDFEYCKPPFISEWLSDLPSKEELESIEDSFNILHSIYGFGDFKKYTMQCISDWSITPIASKEYITGRTLVNKLLSQVNGKKHEMLKKLIELHDTLNNLYKSNFYLRLYTLERENVSDDEINKLEDIEYKINDILDILTPLFDEEERSIFNMINFNNLNKPLSMNSEYASIYIHKRIIDFGWKSELFREFDSVYSNYAYGYPNKNVERVGKKYQWIALYELLARVSDNYKWIDRGYDDVVDKKYYGAIQISKRNVDPTMWITMTQNKYSYYRETTTSWWEMPSFTFSKNLNITPDEWLSDKTIIPAFENMLLLKQNDKHWTVLHGFSEYNQNVEDPEHFPNEKREELWYRINSVIIHKKDREKLLGILKESHLESPTEFGPPKFTNEIFYGEFHWSSYFNRLDVTIPENAWRYKDYNIEAHVPVYEYLWEHNAEDYSLETLLEMYLPSTVLQKELNLHNTPHRYGKWEDAVGNTIFMDPSVYENGYSYALIRTEMFDKWLSQNELELVWIIGGEKQIHHSKNMEYSLGVYGRYTFNIAYVNNGVDVEQIYYKDEFWGKKQ